MHFLSGLCVWAGEDVDPSAGLGDKNVTENHSFIAGIKQNIKWPLRPKNTQA